MTICEKFIPIGKRILVQRLKEEKRGCLMLLDSSKGKDRAKVISLGPQSLEDMEIGQIVLINKYTGQELEIGEDRFLLIKNEDVLGILEE